jgi:hypothetical protein
MNELHETFDDIAGEITPIDPPVDLTMLRGRRMRHRRRAAFVTVTAGAMALLAGAVVGIPALADRPASQGGAAAPASALASHPAGRASMTTRPDWDFAPGTTTSVKPVGDAPLARPVLFFAPRGGRTAYGDASLVNTATMKLFDKLVCTPGPGAYTVDDNWKATVSYTAAQWKAPGSEIVSCDAMGNKYVLGNAVFDGKEITGIAVGLEQNSRQWGVGLTLNAKAAVALGTLTTHQYNTYFPGYQSGVQNDAVLDQIAVVLDGNVQSAPEVNGVLTTGQFEIIGPRPNGFSEAQAKALAAQL